MRFSLLFTIAFLQIFAVISQPDFNKINTASNTQFLRQSEIEMISEINFVRAYPREYIQFIMPYLQQAKEQYRIYGKQPTSFTLRKKYRSDANGNTIVDIDTMWYNQYEEELKAINMLVYKLRRMPPIEVLKPHEGIFNAAKKHGKDLSNNNWIASHKGSDGSWPLERIQKFANDMKNGKENLVSKEAEASAREIVISLLIDAGIKGYGHRENILNPNWTHVACYYGGFHENKHHWVQNFGELKKQQ